MMIFERFEGDYAIIEVDGEMVHFEKHRVHKGVKEGDVLILKDEVYETDQGQTEKRKQYIKNRFKNMWED